MDKFSFIALWDTYGGLLTETQREITDLYFNGDLTVSEIAEEKGISRQAVSECLRGCKRQLEEYEDKLRLCGRLREAASKLTEADKWADRFEGSHPESRKDIRELKGILTK